MKNDFCIQILAVVFLVAAGHAQTSSAQKPCPYRNLFTIGVKTLCESDDGYSIACFGNTGLVKKAHSKCEPGYKVSNEGSNKQTVTCDFASGLWSDSPKQCYPVCSRTLRTFGQLETMMRNKTAILPRSHVEIVRREMKKGAVNRFPGIILFERHILTKSAYFLHEDIYDFVVRLRTSEDSHRDFDIWNFLDNKKEFEFTIIALNDDAYIQYRTNKIRPSCDVSSIVGGSFNKIIERIGASRNRYGPTFNGKCIVPHVSEEDFEFRCESVSQAFKFEKVDCQISADFITKRCHIGYENTKETEYDLLTSCSKNTWSTEAGANGNDCKLVCGEIDENGGQKVEKLAFGGTPTDNRLSPWHVAIFSKNNKEKRFQQICGGSIVHGNIILSAAHCFVDEETHKLESADEFKIAAGKRYRSYDSDETFAQFADIKEFYLPKNYHPQSTQNDIAVVVLDRFLKWSSHVKPVCIHWQPAGTFGDDGVKSGIEGKIVGWGSTSPEDKSSAILLKTNFTTLTRDECRERLDPNVRSTVTGDKFCGVNENEATACRGDSGGGFTIEKPTGSDKSRHFLFGIVSQGIDLKKYCTVGFTTLFTNIQLYQQWVKETIATVRDDNLHQFYFID